MLPMNTKEKETRIVTFKEDYSSEAGKKSGEVIYKKGSTHAIHFKTVKSLEAKGAKMDVKQYDKEAAEKRIKKAMQETEEKRKKAA